MNKKNLRIELVIFDMDGLMFDTEKLSRELWGKAFNMLGYKLDDALFNELIGMNLKSMKRACKKIYGSDFPFGEIKHEKAIMERSHVSSEGIALKKGLKPLLDYLQSLKVKIALATSASRERTELLLDVSGIRGYFQTITCGNEIANSKPAPDIFLKTAEKLNCSPENCLVLEDSINGIRAAYRAGMLPVMVPDMVMPGEDIREIIFKEFKSLDDAKSFFEDSLEESGAVAL